VDIIYPDKEKFVQILRESDSESLDLIVVVTAAFDNIDEIRRFLDDCIRILKIGGLLFVQGCPESLPELGIYLDRILNFKYWIAIESEMRDRRFGLPSVHAAVLLFSKSDKRFNVKRTRFPHQHCAFCRRTLKDWGGKSHLMHPDGYVISDVWMDLPKLDNYTQVSNPALKTIFRMMDFNSGDETDFYNSNAKGVVGPKEVIESARDVKVVSEEPIQYLLPGLIENIEVKEAEIGIDEDKSVNVIHHGDALKILKGYPDESVDLVFADPPYNLDKPYGAYDDEQISEEYIKWCNAWLHEYIRLLKPHGSLYVLNLPQWAMYHAAFLNKRLYFQNWIVWNALSEPRGKLMPAHYSLLFYTKHPTSFTFNYDEVGQLDARYYCLRASCIRKRKAVGVDDKMPLTDIWWDIHRIKHRRDRDHHPCQLPDTLMERIIRLSSNEGDVVLDAFCGVGTTPINAAKLGRRYIAIDIDENYVKLTRQKITQIEQKGYVERESIHKQQKRYTKKELQLELRNLALELGRLSTPEDVEKLSK
jgi:site-specific DNA-methyltransferase (adenine-specific)